MDCSANEPVLPPHTSGKQQEEPTGHRWREEPTGHRWSACHTNSRSFWRKSLIKHISQRSAMHGWTPALRRLLSQMPAISAKGRPWAPEPGGTVSRWTKEYPLLMSSLEVRVEDPLCAYHTYRDLSRQTPSTACRQHPQWGGLWAQGGEAAQALRWIISD